MASTKPSNSSTVMESRKTNKVSELIMQSQVVLDYNGKKGIELFDQLSKY